MLIGMIVIAIHDKPGGLPVRIAYEATSCGDGPMTVAQVLENGNVRIVDHGVQEVKRSELADRLQQVFKTRVERVLFIEANSSLPFNTVAEVIDISEKQVGLVAILTHPVRPGYCLSIHSSPQGIL